MSAKILVLHGLLDGSRQTNIDYSLTLARYPQGNEIHLGNILAPLDRQVDRHTYDALIITYEVAAMRTLPVWPWIVQRITQLRRRCKTFAIFVQDDYTYSKAIDDLAWQLNAKTIFSPLADFAGLLYPQSLNRGTFVEPVLTGYVDTDKARFWKSHAKPLAERSIDLGQRVTFLPTSWGKSAQTKALVAHELARFADKCGFRVSVQTSADSVLTGNAWLEFLASCKFTVGARGGSSRIDYAGAGARSDARRSLLQRIGLNVPGIQSPKSIHLGEFRAIGPRIFEAAMTGTCQVLVHDTYLPEMEPWSHYVPLESDFSNVNEVVSAMSDLDLCQGIAENARRTLTGTASGYHYESLAKQTLLTLDLDAAKSSDEGQVVDLVSSCRPFLDATHDERADTRQAIAAQLGRSQRSVMHRLRIGSEDGWRSDGPKSDAFNALVEAINEDANPLVEAIVWPWIAPLPTRGRTQV
jgi:hypothetical protein